MNIERILKKLSENTQSTREMSRPRNKKEKQNNIIRTSESFGTLTSQPDDNIKQQSSIQFTQGITTNKKQEINGEDRYKMSKIDEEIYDIEKMKNLFQSRRKNNKSIYQSVERQRSQTGKSAEKHSIKPSHTPSFNKFQIANQSKAKNPWKHDLNHSKNSLILNINGNVKSQRDKNNQIANKPELSQVQPLHLPQKYYQSYEDEMDKNKEDGYLEEYESDENHQDIYKNHTQKQCFNNKFEEQDDYPIYKSSQSYSIPALNIENHRQCSCSHSIDRFMSQINQQMSNMLSRVTHLEEENSLLQQNSLHITKINQHYRQKIDTLEDEKNKLNETNERWKIQKEQLETILKDLLFKREKQKLHISKQNSNRAHYIVQQKTAQRQNSHSKMKVQNFLHKLQIKVEKP